MKRLLIVFIILIFAFSGTALAQEESANIGIGAHIGWPTLLGPSVKAWLSPKFGVQGMGAFFSSGDASLTVIGGRVLYKLTQADQKIFPYLGVGMGAWIGDDDHSTETVTTFEFLLGFQHRYSTNFAGDYELGYYMFKDFEDINTDNISGMAFMLAFHYFF